MNKVQSALLCSGGVFFFFVIHQEEEHRLENKPNFTTHFGPVRKCNWSSEIGNYDCNKGLKACHFRLSVGRQRLGPYIILHYKTAQFDMQESDRSL